MSLLLTLQIWQTVPWVDYLRTLMADRMNVLRVLIQRTIRMDQHFSVSIDTPVKLVIRIDSLVNTNLVGDDERWFRFAGNL